MKLSLMLGLLASCGAVGAIGATDGDAAPNLFLSLVPEPGEIPPTELGRWTAQINAEAMREGPATLRLNLPDRPQALVDVTFWSPRQGYLPYGGQMIPDPTAPPEAFSWRWVGSGGRWVVSITLHQGVAAGMVTGYGPYEDWRIEPHGVGQVRLRLIAPQPPLPPPQPRPVPILFGPGGLVMALLIGSFAGLRLRRT